MLHLILPLLCFGASSLSLRCERTLSKRKFPVTSCCFAGDKLDRLFVTSAKIGLTPEQLAKEPHAGSFFEIDPGVTGLPTAVFAG